MGTVPQASLKTFVYEQVARVGKAVANPIRIELLDLLAQGDRTVDVLARLTNQSAATTSHHLQILRRACLVDAQKHGLFVTYRLADDQVTEFLLCLQALAEARLAEIDQAMQAYLTSRGELEAVDTNELVRRIQAGDVTLIDVRPREEYLAGHIPGAMSVPIAELEAHVEALACGRDIVAYCRGRYCVMALDAVELLRKRGRRAHRLELSVPAWRAQGHSVATGERPTASL